MAEQLPTCPRSGLLRSRCRCSDPECYGRVSPTERHESRGARRNRKRREMKRRQQEEARKNWMQEVWKAHSYAHPEMWSEEFKRARDN